MRRAYVRVVRNLTGNGRLSLPRLVLHGVSARLRPGLVSPPAPPLLATLEVTRRCNLHCDYCESREEDGDPPPPSYWFSALDEIVAAGIPAVGITGGEPLLCPELEEIVSRAAGAGCWVHLNTNATLLDARRARALVSGGLSSVNVSLDGATPFLHDGVRGPGSFRRSLDGIRSLVRAREERGRREPRILLAATLGEHNAGAVAPLLELAGELGVDGCTFLPRAAFTVRGGFRTAPRAAEAARLLQDRSRDPRMDNSRAYLRGMERYFRGAAMPRACSALHTSLLVSCDGRLYPCVPSAIRRRGGVPRRDRPLLHVFRSGALRAALDEAFCRRCWWNCHRELDIALGILP